MQESYEIYTKKKIDINLAMRLHSIILSHVYSIPYIAISYSKKTDEITKKL
jgi:polysaccharide pyruvyl transferase WcaK-like protein